MPARMDVAVIGAGPAGLAAAMDLAERGARVDLYEAADDVGGLARSIELWDRRVDLGSHVIADDVPGVAELLQRLLGDRLHRVPLQRGIVIDGRSYEYPFRPANVVRVSGARTSLELLVGFLGRRSEPVPTGSEQSAADWVSARFGRAFHDRFFRPYAEKLWGIPSSRIDASFARDLIGDADQSERGIAAKAWARIHPAPSRHGHSDDFLYPSDGLGALSNAMAAAARAAGARVRTSTRIDRLVIRDGIVGGVESNGRTESYDAVVAAAPLSVISRLVDAPPEIERLVAGVRTRSTVLVYVGVDDEPGFPELWRYVGDPDSVVGRVANLARWQRPDADRSGFPRTLLCSEIWCDARDAVWNASEPDLARRVVDALARAGLVRPSAVIGTRVIRVPATHLIPELGAPRAIAEIRAYLRTLGGLHVIGRGRGLQDVGTSLQSGLVAADAVLMSTSRPIERPVVRPGIRTE